MEFNGRPAGFGNNHFGESQLVECLPESVSLQMTADVLTIATSQRGLPHTDFITVWKQMILLRINNIII